jgi:hypothetical protein
LAEADLVIGLCERFHCLPSQLYQEDASILRLLAIHQKGHPEREDPEEIEEDGEWPA